MKHNKSLSFAALALSVVSLSGCGIQTAIETMALTAAMDLPYIVNNIDIDTQELAQYEHMPTTRAKQADIKYVQNILAIPKTITLDQFNVTVNFEITSPDLTNFLIFEQDLADLGEGGAAPAGLEGVGLTAFVMIPVGTGDYAFKENTEATSSLTNFADYLSGSFEVMDVVKITEQLQKEIKIDVTGKIGGAEKTKSFYFKINRTSLDDLASIANTSLEDLGVPAEIAEYIADWPAEPQQEVLDYVADSWPAEMPTEMQTLIDNNEWPADLPVEWQEEWPSPEVAETWIEENWPENLSDLDWAAAAGILGMMDMQPQGRLPRA
ncbi:MAG TPA: hypothetical protein VJZ31_00140 [Bacilli bacterium]|nr:hypothetical protein [Bacilli bacterium]